MIEGLDTNGNSSQKELARQSKMKTLSTKGSTFDETLLFTTDNLKAELGLLRTTINDSLLNRMYTNISKVFSFGKEPITHNDYLLFIQSLNGNNRNVNKETAYRFFDTENKGFVTKDDFVEVISDIINFVSSYNKEDIKVSKSELEDIYENLKSINVSNIYNNSIYNDQSIWISKSKFILLIESKYLNIYDIIHNKKTNKYKNGYQISFPIMSEINNLVSSFNKFKKMIIQKIDIESSLTVCTDEYLDENAVIENNNNLNIENNKRLSKHRNFAVKVEKPLRGSENDSLSEISMDSDTDSIIDNINHNRICDNGDMDSEIQDTVYEIDNQTIKTLKGIKENKERIKKENDKSDNLTIKNKDKKFSFLKPFTNISDIRLKKEIMLSGIELEDTLILVNKNDFLSYLDNIESTLNKIMNQINEYNPTMFLDVSDKKANNVYINKPLKQKDYINQVNDSINRDIFINDKKLSFYCELLFSIQKTITENEYRNIIDSDSYKEIKSHTSTNAHKNELTEYAPKIFENIRKDFSKIRNSQYRESFNMSQFWVDIITGNQMNLKSIINEECLMSTSYEHFAFFSPDGKYIIKSLLGKEFELLLSILPNYYNYLSTTQYSLLEIFCGLFKLSYKGKESFFCIKTNVFYSTTGVNVNVYYELKGSKYKRNNERHTLPFKDLEFIEKRKEKLFIMKEEKFKIYNTMQSDTNFLKENNITNYSFIIGIASQINDMKNEMNWYPSLKSNEIYSFGIIDILREYDNKKKVEKFFKSITQGNDISCQPPNEYMERFNSFIRGCFN